ncbi:hypothetical protein [Paenirhodobacter sp.]|uniref:hypothetical protein n=1 Tax=Paenirhodobacter sp. TaxID=1965326 RepID=UPI003B3CABC1
MHDPALGAATLADARDVMARLGRNRMVLAHAPIGNAGFGALAAAGARIALCPDTRSALAHRRAGMEFVLDARTVFGWAPTAGARGHRNHRRRRAGGCLTRRRRTCARSSTATAS